MAGLRTEHCVEIRLPARSGGPCFGSGYALAPHWVLTAHHVLFADDRDPGSTRLEIVWRDAQGAAMSPRSVSRDQILWHSERHDIALVRCQPPPNTDLPGAWELIAQARPAAGSRCDCVGYLAGLQDEARQPRRKSPSGTLANYSPREIAADLDGLSVQLEGDKYWSGFSGSAVFAGHRLVGVVRTVNTGERGKGLTLSFVAPALMATGDGAGMVPLREVPGFLVCPGPQACWDKLRAGVIQRLDHHARLSEHLAASCREALPEASEIDGSEALAGRIFDLPRPTLCRALERALEAMLQAPRDLAGVQGIEYLALIWLRLLAAEQGAVPPLGGASSTPGDAPLPVMASRPLLLDLESKLAEASGGEPLLRATADYLRSPLDLTPAHNTGLDPHCRQAQQDAKDAYALKNRPGMGMELFRPEEAKRQVKEIVVDSGIGLALSDLPPDDATCGRFVSGLLPDRGNRRYYVRVPVTWQGAEAQAVRALGGWAPELLVIDVDPVEDWERSRDLAALHRIILRCQTALSDGESARTLP